jgi:DNA-binding transcriptional LysR family regulator
LVDIAQLEALVAVVDAGTFTAAADQLGLTQSALTRKIQALEAECGTTLLVRRRPRVEPTATGHELLAGARRIQVEMDQLRELVMPSDTELHGRIRAAATPIGLSYIYWPICEQFLRRYPRVDLAFKDVELPTDGPRLVRTGAVDVAFSALPPNGAARRLNVVRLGTVETVLIAQPEHGLATGTPVALDDIRSERMLLYRRLNETGEYASQTWLGQLGDQASTFETGDVEYVKRLVMLGRGISALPWPAVAQEVADGRLVRLYVQAPALVQTFGLVYGTGRVPRPVRALADFCRSLPCLELHAAG